MANMKKIIFILIFSLVTIFSFGNIPQNTHLHFDFVPEKVEWCNIKININGIFTDYISNPVDSLTEYDSKSFNIEYINKIDDGLHSFIMNNNGLNVYTVYMEVEEYNNGTFRYIFGSLERVINYYCTDFVYYIKPDMIIITKEKITKDTKIVHGVLQYDYKHYGIYKKIHTHINEN